MRNFRLLVRKIGTAKLVAEKREISAAATNHKDRKTEVFPRPGGAFQKRPRHRLLAYERLSRAYKGGAADGAPLDAEQLRLKNLIRETFEDNRYSSSSEMIEIGLIDEVLGFHHKDGPELRDY